MEGATKLKLDYSAPLEMAFHMICSYDKRTLVYYSVCMSRVASTQSQHCSGPLQLSVGGVTVSIVAFQAIDPGSTPGQRILFF